MERGEKYDDPICEALEDAGVGYVDGGGTKLSNDGVIEYCYVDVEAEDVNGATEVIRRLLASVGAPSGSTIAILRR